MAAIPSSLEVARSELNRLLSASALAGADASNLVPPARPVAEPVVVTVVQRIMIEAPVAVSAVAVQSEPSSIAVPAVSSPSTSSSSSSSSSSAPVGDIPDLPLTESAAQEIQRLEDTVRDLSEVNDRIMAQNIALLSDLEAAQKAVRELRGEKDTLAKQLKEQLERAAAAAAAVTASAPV